MSVAVRTARSDDLEGVLRLYRELRPHDPSLEPNRARDVLAGLIRDDRIDLIVCESEGVLTATCMLAIVQSLASGARPFGVVEHVVTLSEFRRCGYARRALEHALSLAWSKSCYKVVLLSGAQRKEAHKLYESVGFVGGIEEGFVARPTIAEFSR